MINTVVIAEERSKSHFNRIIAQTPNILSASILAVLLSENSINVLI